MPLPLSIETSHADINLFFPNSKRQRCRGSYKCSKCGLPKKGHICSTEQMSFLSGHSTLGTTFHTETTSAQDNLLMYTVGKYTQPVKSVSPQEKTRYQLEIRKEKNDSFTFKLCVIQPVFGCNISTLEGVVLLEKFAGDLFSVVFKKELAQVQEVYEDITLELKATKKMQRMVLPDGNLGSVEESIDDSKFLASFRAEESSLRGRMHLKIEGLGNDILLSGEPEILAEEYCKLWNSASYCVEETKVEKELTEIFENSIVEDLPALLQTLQSRGESLLAYGRRKDAILINKLVCDYVLGWCYDHPEHFLLLKSLLDSVACCLRKAIFVSEPVRSCSLSEILEPQSDRKNTASPAEIPRSASMMRVSSLIDCRDSSENSCESSTDAVRSVGEGISRKRKSATLYTGEELAESSASEVEPEEEVFSFSKEVQLSRKSSATFIPPPISSPTLSFTPAPNAFVDETKNKSTQQQQQQEQQQQQGVSVEDMSELQGMVLVWLDFVKKELRYQGECSLDQLLLSLSSRLSVV